MSSPARQLFHVDAGAGVEHRAALGQRDHREGARHPERAEARPLQRVDGDVDLRRAAVADVLAVEEHRGFVLLPLADHDHAVHRDRVEDEAHRVDRGAVGGELVAAADPAGRREGGRLGHPDELQGEVAIRLCLARRRHRRRGRYKVAAWRDAGDLTLPLSGVPLAEHGEYVKRAEAAGYTDLWTGETAGPDGFTPLALSAAWTERVRLGTGIVGVFQRGPALLAQEAAALADASNGRFVLGIGSSSDRIIEGWNGIPFEKPLSKVRETLEFLRVALAGERTATRFKLETKPAHEVPIVLAALRGKMLQLAVEEADGAFTNFLPLDGLPQVVDQIAGAPEDFELLCRFFLLPGHARGGRAARPLHVLLLHHRPGLHRVLQLARLGREDPADAGRLGRPRPREGGGRGALGGDRADVHLRLARRR